MKLKICPICKKYTLKDICEKCEINSKDAHYKFIKIRDAPKKEVAH